MGDIVEKLRDKSHSHPQDGEQLNHVIRRMNIQRLEAADEIERLRKLVNELHQVIKDGLCNSGIPNEGDLAGDLNNAMTAWGLNIDGVIVIGNKYESADSKERNDEI